MWRPAQGDRCLGATGGAAMSVGPKWMVVLAVCVVMAAVVTWDVGGK